MRRKVVAAVALSGGELGPHLTHCGTGRGPYLRTKWHHDPSSRLATTDMGRKVVAAVALSGGELGPHLTHCGIGRGLYLRTKWHHDPSSVWPQQTWAEKWGRLLYVPVLGGAGSPSNTMWPRPRFNSILSAILIHPTEVQTALQNI